jgi:hypothetical protein
MQKMRSFDRENIRSTNRRECGRRTGVAHEQPAANRSACPHCGKPPGLRWWYLLPSNNPKRVFTCAQCGGKYDLSDPSKIAAIMGALLGSGPAILIVGKIARYGHGQAVWIALGTAAAAAVFLAVTVLVSRLALRLVAKD